MMKDGGYTEDQIKNFKTLDKNEIVLTKKQAEELLKTIDFTRKLTSQLPNLKPLDIESLDSQIANIQKRIDQSNKMLGKE